MGVPGLLPYMKKACQEGNITQFEGKSLLVDASCLLHRGLIGCAEKIAMRQETDFYVGYVWKYVKLLLARKCHVILVFDGRPLPAKKTTNDSRRESREKYQILGEQLMSQGLKGEAFQAFCRGAELTRDIVEKTIRSFRNVNNVDVIVAPYEADAQIAYMVQKGFAHAVITEDSDLIVFGCDKIIFKMNPTDGSCVIYEKEKMPNCLCPILRRKFQFPTFRRICILAGCDYLQGGLQGVGLKGAEEIFAKTNQPELKTLLPRLPLYLNKRMRSKLDKNFVNDFIKAENTFLYQVVYDPNLRQQVPLNAYPVDEEEKENSMSPKESVKYPYAGEMFSPRKATRLALGNPENKLHLPTIADEFVFPVKIPEWSIWNLNYKNILERKEEEEELILEERFGAFKPPKSPIIKKRHAAELIGIPLSEGEAEEIGKTFEEKNKKRRFSEVETGLTTPKNGIYSRMSCDDWMRKYGMDKSN
uniref:Exonuclease 1 n=1 Tax=Meloidogyne incognita TaxID=6306 RepID=A0A914LTY5_MELIC